VQLSSQILAAALWSQPILSKIRLTGCSPCVDANNKAMQATVVAQEPLYGGELPKCSPFFSGFKDLGFVVSRQSVFSFFGFVSWASAHLPKSMDAHVRGE